MDNYSDEGYDSNDEISFEVTEIVDNKPQKQLLNVPYRPIFSNEKRLICFSIINNEPCNYGTKCTYAHSLEEQNIDIEKKFIYQIVLDDKLMDFPSMSDPKLLEIYKHLLFLTYVCKSMHNSKCTGGYNCRHGVHDSSFKVCKNDLLTGQCLNQLISIEINPEVLKKIDGIKLMDKYIGCINGHHLTERKMIPYYKYIHQKKNLEKFKEQPITYIDINQINNLFKDTYPDDQQPSIFNSDESTDEEINGWFQELAEEQDENEIQLEY